MFDMEKTSKLNNGSFGKATIFSLLLILLFSPNIFAQVNKCKINGKIVYTDKDCPDDTAEVLDLSKSSFSTAPSLAPSEARKFSSISSSSSSSRINSPGWLHDKSGYEKALKVSAVTRVPIFIYAYTDWCGYCKKLQKNIYQDSSVKKVLAQFIKVKINPEHSPEDEALFHQWGGRGYPTLYTQPTTSSSPSRTKGPFTKKNGKWELMTINDFIAMLRSRL